MTTLFITLSTFTTAWRGGGGIAFLSTGYIERRLERGVACGQKGYAEIYSRIGRRYYELEPTNHIDVEVVCEANGLTDKGQIAKVVAVARDSDYDMRVAPRDPPTKRIAAAKTAPEKQSNIEYALDGFDWPL